MGNPTLCHLLPQIFTNPKLFLSFQVKDLISESKSRGPEILPSNIHQKYNDPHMQAQVDGTKLLPKQNKLGENV